MDDELMLELLKDLIAESMEGLDQFEEDLVVLEKGEGDKELLNAIFRVVHSIKGSSGCLGLGIIEAITHQGENLLDDLRSEKLTVTPELISLLLELSDCLRGLFVNLENTGSEGSEHHPKLVERLINAREEEEKAPANNAWGLFEDEIGQLKTNTPPPSVEISPKKEPVENESENENYGLFEEEDSPKPESDESTQHAAAPTTSVETPEKSAAKELDPSSKKQSKSISDSIIRVDVEQLDNIMNLVGELVLARNQIVQKSNALADDSLIVTSQHINTITTELQESVMKTRMQPIGNIWAKFPRIVRDLARDLNKGIVLNMEGQTTELDRSLIEAIKDPLMHIIRNSVDHGIENPDTREANGKTRDGTLLLKAFHEGGQVNIEIIDDGAGINIDVVRQKAIEKGVITADMATELRDRDIHNLVFHPGFSTADKVSNVSGRGVGMDVVKTNIEKIGGTIEIESKMGIGTTIRLKIPLTLAIIPALIVRSSNERFAIPQMSLLELVRLEGRRVIDEIESLYGSPVFRLRGKLLPLAYLNEQLKITPLDDADKIAAEGLSANIVILQADGKQFGLIVDEVLDTEEIVVKPLSKQLKSASAFAGATIMGDGKVALILDVLGISKLSGISSNNTEELNTKSNNDKKEDEENKQSLVIFEAGQEGARMAVPLSMISRLEEFDSSKVTGLRDAKVVEYRDKLLALVHLVDYLPGLEGPPVDEEVLHAIVYTENDKSIGLVVSKFIDILEERVIIKRRSSTPGVIGSAVIRDEVTEILDVQTIIAKADPSFFEKTA